jgi:hypothetical protein
MQPTYFIVKKEHVGDKELNGFLRTAIGVQFKDTNYNILGEQTLDTLTTYSPTQMRKIKSFYVEEGEGGAKHIINFDISECSESWLSQLGNFAR